MDTRVEFPKEFQKESGPVAPEGNADGDDILLRALLEMAASAEHNHERADHELDGDEQARDAA
jgi:hypothetical protein